MSRFTSISKQGFTPDTIRQIDKYINDIYNGNINADRFNTAEHAGLCSAGKVLIGAQTIASYARTSLSSGGDAGESQATIPSNWQIDEAQEKLVEQWARAAGIMRVIGFSRDSEGLFRIILSQPYIQCERLATNSEILDYVASKGLQPNKDDFKESFINDRIILEDMHPANVFIDIQSGKPVCIDCIVKFR